MNDLAILGLLREQDLHGYELRKRITDLVGIRPAVSYGALYPALDTAGGGGGGHGRRREHRGRGSPADHRVAGRRGRGLLRPAARGRPAAPHAGRARKAYSLTEAGERLLIDLIEDPATDDRVFALKVAFCRYLPPPRRLELFERRRATLAGRLAGERSSRRKVAERLDLYLRSLREHDHRTIQHDIAWLDELIANERAALTATGPSREEDSTP